MSSTGGQGSWYWCLRHRRAEPEGGQCPADDRLGPYASRQEALDWRARVEARNEAWDEEDERWTGDEDKPGG